MTQYFCAVCNFSSPLSANFKRHLKTNKHFKNEEKARVENEKKNKIPSDLLQNPPKSEEIHSDLLQNPSNLLQNPSKIIQNMTKISRKLKKSEKSDIHSKISDIHSKISESNLKIPIVDSKNQYICENCNRHFSRKDNLKRHMATRCKATKPSNDGETLDYKEMFYYVKDELEKEKKEFKKQISMLLEKVGNTTNHITNTQNIQLNSYGSEDLSHITDSLKDELIKLPFGMIPKMIEAVHFNSDKPENKNIVLTNKKDNKIMVFKNNKWVYCNKDETINDLVDGKYFILDNHYQQMENDSNIKISNVTKTTYENFKHYFDEGDKKLVEQLKKDCELILLNNR